MDVTSRCPKPRQYRRHRGLLLRNAYFHSKNVEIDWCSTSTNDDAAWRGYEAHVVEEWIVSR
jgi:CRISPR/Cas system CMR-associated protein Cmr5 small subunit